MYILDEEQFINDILTTNEKPLDLSITYLISLLSKYYINNNYIDIFGAITKKLNKMNLPYYEEYLYAKKIREIYINNYGNSEYKKIKYIPVYQDEIDIISTLPSDRHKKMMFTIIILSRYMNCGGWINKKDISGITEMYKLSNIHASVKDCGTILYDLKELGFIEYAKSNNNLNIKLVFQSNKENEVYQLTEFKNIGNQYIGNFKKGWKQCKCCGKKIRANSKNNNLYCTSCAKEIERKNNTIRKRKSRENQ